MTVTPDTDAAVEFLLRWAPDGLWNLTYVEPSKKGIQTRTFGPDEVDAMRAWITEHNGTRNIYFSVNPLTHRMSKKAERTDIRSVEWLHVDIDPRPGKKIDEEQERARRLLEEPPEGIPPPTVVVFSGGGYQGFWRLEEPIPINGDLAAAEDAKRFNQQIELVYGADNCHNIDRIMRLPGTVNIPDAKKRKKGRVEALAELVAWHEDRLYPLGMFKAAPKVQLLDSGGFSTGETVQVSGNIERLDDVDALDEWGVPDRIKVIIVQGRHPDEGPKERDDSRSAWLFDCLCGLVRADVPDDVVYAVITDPDFGISESVIDKGSSMEKYALRQMERAKEESVSPHLRAMNERHAVIGNMGGRCRVIEEIPDRALGRVRLTKQSFEDIRNRYCSTMVEAGVDEKGNVKMKPLGAWWLTHSKRREYRTITFAPNTETPMDYNLWKGFACEARPGKCDLFMEHLRTNVCRGHQGHFDYLMGWLANCVQHPDRPGQVAVVLRGGQGTGKSSFATIFGSLWGRHFLQVSDPKHLVGSFNSHLRDCVVIFGDEAFYAGDKKHESILKTLITEDTIIIEGKGVDAEVASNYTHLILASNNEWVVPAGVDERRYFVLDVGDGQKQNREYFQAIRREMDHGGREALLHMLLNHDLSEFDIRAVPRTDALQEQKLLSLSPDEEWWYNKLVEGRILPRDDGWEQDIRKDFVVADYQEYMRKTRNMRPSTVTALTRFFNRTCPAGTFRSVQRTAEVEEMDDTGYQKVTRRRCYFYRFPTLREARDAWSERTGERNWPDD